MKNDEFRIWLGEIRNDETFLRRAMRGARRGGLGNTFSRQPFVGERSARGAGVGRVLAWRNLSGERPHRRATAKLYRVLLNGHGYEAVRQHLRYLTRDGKGREGGPPSLYSQDQAEVDAMGVVRASQEDRHQFRMVVAADDAPEYEDLRPYIRRLMKQVTRDLRVELDWVAADHFDTGNPHTHVAIRGRDRSGSDVIIAPEYIKHGLTERASQLVSLDLGPSDSQNLGPSRSRLIEYEGPTEIDQDLLVSSDLDGLVASYDPNGWQQSARAGRLKFLGKLGLASGEPHGRWRLEPHIVDRLHQIEHLNEKAREVDRSDIDDLYPAAQANPAKGDIPGARNMIGRVISVEAASGSAVLMLDGVDGRVHRYVLDPSAMPMPTSIVRIRTASREEEDRDEPRGQLPFLDERACEASSPGASRSRASNEELPDAVIQPHPEGRPFGSVPQMPPPFTGVVEYELLGSRPMEDLIHWGGSTWLDRELVNPQPTPLGEGFGSDVRDALDQRRHWLVSENLADALPDHTRYRPDLLQWLEMRERRQFATEFARISGLRFVEDADQLIAGQREDGPVVIGDQQVAIMQNGYEFSLTPWQAPSDGQARTRRFGRDYVPENALDSGTGRSV
jgi:hypothetical protein